jgi:predicted nucleic acid-binding protein
MTMVYLDTSAVLAYLFAEDRRPPDELWLNSMVSSRLLEYEVLTRVNGRGGARADEEAARSLLGRVAFLELIPEVVERARERFPSTVRTLDALHLASAVFLLKEGVPLRLATYDERMQQAAKKLKIPLYAKL